MLLAGIRALNAEVDLPNSAQCNLMLSFHREKKTLRQLFGRIQKKPLPENP